MKIKILCGFRFFKLSENTEYEINPFILTSDIEILRKEYSSVEFLSIIGSHRVKVINSEPSFGHNILETPNTMIYDFQQFQQDAAKIAGKINSFISFLWFVKDCRSHTSENIFYAP